MMKVLVIAHQRPLGIVPGWGGPLPPEIAHAHCAPVLSLHEGLDDAPVSREERTGMNALDGEQT
jgi:hypothetical protein